MWLPCSPVGWSWGFGLYPLVFFLALARQFVYSGMLHILVNIETYIHRENVEVEKKVLLRFKILVITKWLVFWNGGGIAFVLTIHGTPLGAATASSCHDGTCPSLTGALKGQARPVILVLTGRGLSVRPRSLKLWGTLLFCGITCLVLLLW
jgi:hypothetical protein